jgi:uncharacterized protein HemX
METISYQIIIIAFVILIAAIIVGVSIAAFRYGRQWRNLNEDNLSDQQLIKMMEEEREQKNRIIKIIKSKKYTHLN